MKRVLYIILMLLIISLISFLAINLAPNSFFASGELNPNITEEDIAKLKSIYGLDQPLYIQYFAWLKALLHLDFGISFASGQNVKEEILSRLPITLIINLASMALIFGLSLYLGIKSALKQDSLFDKGLKQFSLISYSMPSFYLALLLIIYFAVNLELFPISGIASLEPKTGLSAFFDQVWHLILPIFVIVFGGIGTLSMYIRSLTIEILKSDYIFFAKARGIKQAKIIRYYILPNPKKQPHRWINLVT
jgi:peptide/nickel transport system permease protein